MSIFCNKFIVVKAQRFWGLLGAGVPPLLGALTPFAYWGALLLFSFPLSVLILLRRLFFLAARQSLQAASALAPLRQFRFPLLVTRCKLNN